MKMKVLTVLLALAVVGVALAQPVPGEGYQTYLDKARGLIRASKFAEAEDPLRRAYDEAVNANMPVAALLMPLKHLGDIYRWQDKYEEAEVAYRQIIELHAADPGRAPGLAAVALDLAAIYRKTKQPEKAADVLDMTARMARQAPGAGGAELLPLLGALAAHFAETGKRAEAEALLTEAVEAAERECGATDFRVAAPCLALAEHYRIQKAFPRAEPLYARALKLTTTAKRMPDPFPLVDVYTALGRCADDQGKSDAAAGHYAAAVTALEDFFGPCSPSEVRAFARIAAAHEAAGRPAQAEALLLRAQKIANTVYGPGREEASILDQYAALLRKQGKTAEADAAAAQAAGMRAPAKK